MSYALEIAPAVRQLTVRAIGLGIVLSVVLASANAYLGLRVGMTVSASIPAAVISMAILKLFRDSNILENNIVQTAASAGESLAAGVIFTFPALIILNYWNTFDYIWVSIVAGLGGLLGVLFTIPLRRSLIVEQQLAYPEGTATAEVLRAGDDRGGAKLIGLAALIGGVTKLCETGFRLWPSTAQAAGYAGQSTIAYVGTNLAPALIGVGYIVGLNVAVLVFLGGAISWYVAIPIYSTWLLDGDPVLAAQFAGGLPAADLAGAIWTSRIRYLGVGAMLVGGIWALFSMRGSLLSGLRSGLAQRTEILNPTEHDTPMRWVLIGVALFVVPVAALYYAIVGSVGAALAMTLIMVVAGFLFSAVAAYMAGLVGSSQNPVSGVTIATILFASLLLLLIMGRDAGVGPAAAIMVGAVVCCAAAIGGDNMQDLKAGYLVGATPWKQQVMQCVGVIAAVFVMAPILNLLLQAYGFGAPTADQPDALPAPQATLMASVAQGVFGGGLPWRMVASGAGIGILMILIDETLRIRGSAWRAPVLAVAVGLYLPLELSVPILAGGLIAHAVARARKGRAASRAGVLFAAGLITGEALIGIALAMPIASSGSSEILAFGIDLTPWAGLAVIAAIGMTLYRIAARQ
ncbi:MAG TPA: oligopeptide transporter, OPT family [Gammaproteobacteria bacterium]|nr:oligopeptide transporter, OPT family [Gammaproteobacteria bacterium]